jgi:hypothetical protein
MSLGHRMMVMMVTTMKCNMNQKVLIDKTNSDELDGFHGTILGIASEHPECTFYIVGVDIPSRPEATALVLTEYCFFAIDQN